MAVLGSRCSPSVVGAGDFNELTRSLFDRGFGWVDGRSRWPARPGTLVGLRRPVGTGLTGLGGWFASHHLPFGWAGPGFTGMGPGVADTGGTERGWGRGVWAAAEGGLGGGVVGTSNLSVDWGHVLRPPWVGAGPDVFPVWSGVLPCRSLLIRAAQQVPQFACAHPQARLVRV